MKGKVPIIVGLLLLIAVVGGGWWWLTTHPEAASQILSDLGLEMAGPPLGVLAASGIIEAQEVSITTETGGQVARLLADEGDQVKEGEVLAELDTALLEAQIREGEAALALAQANLAQAEAGARKEEVEAAEAALKQALAAQEGAEQAWLDALALKENPQELLVRIEAGKSGLAAAELQLAQAEAQVEAAEAQQDFLGQAYEMVKEGLDISFTIPGVGEVKRRIKPGPATIVNTSRQWNLASQESWMAWSAYYQALAARDGARRQLDILLEMRDNPIAAQAEVDAALTQYEIAQAKVAQAQAHLEALKAGATEYQLDMARAQVQEAEANLAVLEVQRGKMTLRAPRAGIILERIADRGEMVAPGAPLLKLADLDRVTLTVYVPETEIGRVKVGQEAQIEVDSYPGRRFAGHVTFIASEAEFTPQNVQTKEQKASLVFGVKIEIPNPEHLLRPGMPADAYIEVGGG